MSDIERWLDAHELGKYGRVFAENDIDLDVLPELTDAELGALGLSLGHRKKLLKAARDLAQPPGVAQPS